MQMPRSEQTPAPEHIERRGKIFTPQEGRIALIEAVARLFEAVDDAEDVTVSMHGIIDSERGYCAMGGTLRYNDDFHFRDALYEWCKTKIHIESRGRCGFTATILITSMS